MLYCTLLAKAESDADRERIEEEMSTDPEKKAILKVSVSYPRGWGWAGQTFSSHNFTNEDELVHDGLEGQHLHWYCVIVQVR